MNHARIVLTLIFVTTTYIASFGQKIETVILRLEESLLQKNAKLIVITPENNIEYRDLVNGIKPEELANNLLVLKEEIDSWAKQGFEVITANAIGIGCTYVLQRKKE